nr:tRNA 2-thiouridine(34) synthase MnmA [Spirochaeta africana]
MKIAVLLSGGVDSSVALNLLLRQGYTDITAYYLKIWLEDEMAYMGSCPWEEDLQYAEAVCDQAGVPLKVLPLQQQYYDRVVSYAIDELRAGRTPSPDIFCNQRIKFGAFWDELQEHYDYVATGHYARIDRLPPGSPLPPFLAGFGETTPGGASPSAGEAATRRAPHGGQGSAIPREPSAAGAADQPLCLLRRAPDPVKDQSYFLSHLSQDQLQKILFPLGEYTKAQVRAFAQEFDLPTKDRKDSQGICFLGKIRYPEFVGHYLGEQDGPLVERETGTELGRHKGYWYFTIGQRQGIGLGNGPWYVVGKDVAQNIVYISHSSHRDEAKRSSFRIENMSWTVPAPDMAGFAAGGWGRQADESGADDAAGVADMPAASGNYPLLTKLRHGPELTPCSLNPDTGLVQLQGGDQGVAPGQFSVLYAGEYCLGGGRICADEVSTGQG